MKVRTLIVSAINAGTINGKKTTTIPKDIDDAVNGLGLDVKAINVASAGPNLPDQMLVTVLYEPGADEESHKKKSR